MGMFRIADNPALEEEIESIALKEDRSAAKMREILLKEAVAARTGMIIVDPKDVSLPFDENGKLPKPAAKKNKSVEQAQKRIDTATAKLAQQGSKKLKAVRAKIDKAVASEISLCEHYQEKGKCMVKGCKYGNKN